MKAPAGAEVRLYIDTDRTVRPGEVIETARGRRYGVVRVRLQTRGKHAGRQHLTALVLAEDDVVDTGTHRIRWYARTTASARAGAGRGA